MHSRDSEAADGRVQPILKFRLGIIVLPRILYIKSKREVDILPFEVLPASKKDIRAVVPALLYYIGTLDCNPTPRKRERK